VKIGVCLKQVPATDARIKISDPDSGIDTSDIKWEINPYDEFALEEAVLLKEAGKASQVIIFTVGDKSSEANLKNGLARGADAAVRIDNAGLSAADALGTARALAAAISAAGVEIVLTGKQAVDGDRAQVPAMLAEVLGWSQIQVISKVEVADGQAKGWRNTGGGNRDVIATSLPVVLTMDKGGNPPRYPSLRNIMMAKRKKIAVQPHGQTSASHVVENNWGLPPQRQGVQWISGEGAAAAKELVRLLREDAKVI